MNQQQPPARQPDPKVSESETITPDDATPVNVVWTGAEGSMYPKGTKDVLIRAIARGLESKGLVEIK